MKIATHRFSFLLFVASVACLFFCYGVVVIKYHVFPYRVLALAKNGYEELFAKKEPNKSISLARYPNRPAIRNTSQACEGLNLVTSITAEKMLSAKIMDLDGKKIHEWVIDWFKIWPDAKHVPARLVPRSRPGATIGGAVIMENSDLVFNFEHLGLVRMDLRGKVVWRLPYQTHHSVEKDNNGNLWVCGQKEHAEKDARFPNYMPPFIEEMALEVSPKGEIIKEWSIPDLLRKNKLAGLLYLGRHDNNSTQVGGDVLHMNDAEPFQTNLTEGFFKRGDILVSLRNINTVFVFNRESEKIKFIVVGMFVRQHDPDFIDGNTISVFDNNNIAPERDGFQSRIVIVSAPDKAVKVFFEGSPETPLYTATMGKHQWLPNGNLLITEAKQGRAFEVNRRGEIVWEYINYIDNGVVGMIGEVQRLPPEYTRLFSGLEVIKNKINGG